MLRLLTGLCAGIWLSVWVVACGPQRGLDGELGIADLDQLDAFLAWDCEDPEPAVFLNVIMLLDPIDEAATVAHEHSHYRDAVGMGCEAWHKWRQDPGHKMVTEAKAFCAGWSVRVRAGQDPKRWFKDYAKRLAWGYDKVDLSVAEAEAVLSLYCGGYRP